MVLPIAKTHLELLGAFRVVHAQNPRKVLLEWLQGARARARSKHSQGIAKRVAYAQNLHEVLLKGLCWVHAPNRRKVLLKGLRTRNNSEPNDFIGRRETYNPRRDKGSE